MTRHFVKSLGLAVLLLTPSHAALAADDTTSLVERGEYLAKAGDCAACHRTPQDAGRPYAGGYVIHSPMGEIVASNITPSISEGIGAYSEQDFAQVLTQGVRPDGSHLYPAMPYTAYRGLKEEDIHALYTYFMQGVEPVDAAVPETNLSFPFNLRFSMAGWNLLFLKDPYTPDPLHDAEVDRGHYLVDTLGHCSSCHTPRNVLMGEQQDRYLAGASIEGWHAPNITSDASGIGSWSEEELVTYLQSGHVAGRAQAGGGMAEAIEHSLRHLSEEDLRSMAAYLKQVPPIETGKPVDVGQRIVQSETLDLATLEPPLNVDPDVMSQGGSLNGQLIYQGACASCHQIDGQGTDDNFYPSLVHNTATQGENPDNLVMAILEGVHRKTNEYTVSMPAFHHELNDEQVAAVSNYVLSQFGNPELSVDAAHVGELRRGGETPWLVKAMPWLLTAGGVMALVVVVAIVVMWRRRKARR